MALYTETQEMSPLWPEPIEHVYQLLGGGDASAIAPKLPHLGLSDILFMVLIMSLPRERRPWGIATWTHCLTLNVTLQRVFASRIMSPNGDVNLHSKWRRQREVIDESSSEERAAGSDHSALPRSKSQ